MVMMTYTCMSRSRGVFNLICFMLYLLFNLNVGILADNRHGCCTVDINRIIKWFIELNYN
jgi:hypothetical protein